jgi:hypothetical protein
MARAKENAQTIVTAELEYPRLLLLTGSIASRGLLPHAREVISPCHRPVRAKCLSDLRQRP